jgi:hypothetical protein
MRIRYLLFFATLLPCISRADIVECNGVVTNKACTTGSNDKLFDEGETIKNSEAPKENQPRKTTIDELLSGLDSVRFSLKQSHGLIFDILPIKTLCQESTVKECAEIVQDAQLEMNRLVVERERTKKDEPSPAESSTNTPSTTVVTINQPPIVVVRPRRINPPPRDETSPKLHHRVLRSPAAPPSTQMKKETPN